MATKQTTEGPTASGTDSEESLPIFSLEEMELENISGLGPKSAKLLREGGIHTPTDLMRTSMDQIEVMGLTRTTAKKLRAEMVKLFPNQFTSFVEKFDFEDIDGIGPTIAKSMREKGLNVHILENSPLKELEERYGVSSTSAEKYKQFIAENIRGGWFIDAYTHFTQQQTVDTISFGAASLDQLFLIPEIGTSGIRLGETYEFFGAFRSGKSQICHQLAVTAQLPKNLGGVGKKAIYIDTEGTFSPARISQMAERLRSEKEWNKSTKDILSDIMYARVMNSDMQQVVTLKLLEFLGDHPDEYSILIIDSITAHFRAEYAGRGTLAERQQTLNHHLSMLHRIADIYGLAIVVTNQVQSNPAQFFGDPTQAIGGNIVGHWAGTRCYLRKSKGEKRVIRIFDSPVFPELEGVFAITEQGVISDETTT
ncbi:MAG: DNA repair and recombination protein RadA [Candidatus Kariarchaeaceae archaeon]|jgi:DNA repair protein RadA